MKDVARTELLADAALYFRVQVEEICVQKQCQTHESRLPVHDECAIINGRPSVESASGLHCRGN